MEIFSSIGTWFGYVGACAVAPDATCRPFLAFLALGAAAAAALTLILLAYRKANAGEIADLEERRLRKRNLELQARVHRTLAGKPVTPKSRAPGRFPVAA